MFLAIALLVLTVILLFTPASKLAKSRQQQHHAGIQPSSSQNGRTSSSGWRNPYVNDFKALTDNVICGIEQFQSSEVNEDSFQVLLGEDKPRILVPTQGVAAWSTTSHLWHLGTFLAVRLNADCTK